MTNSVQIFHGDVTYINQPEIPEYTIPYLDDVNVRGGPTRYETADGSFETIPQNAGIRRFVWEHLQVVNRILQRMKYAGGTYSGLKALIAAPEAMVTSHLCSYEGQKVDSSRIAKIVNWSPLLKLTDVHAFIRTVGLCHSFIE